VTSFESGLPGGKRFVPGTGWTDEREILDERYAAIDVAGKGLVIFSACSHAGIVNVVKDAVATFSRPVYMVYLLFIFLVPARATQLTCFPDYRRAASSW